MSMEKKIVECVPNFSEGRNMAIIKQITDEIERVKGVKLLDVDPGEATNRTVVTFVGEPDAVLEAAFQAVGKAGQLIDMRGHHGAHPRSVPNWPTNWPSALPANTISPATAMRLLP